MRRTVDMFGRVRFEPSPPPHYRGEEVYVPATEQGREPDHDLSHHYPRRTRYSHPYNFDPHTIWGSPYPNKRCNGVDYTDRLDEWDYTKYHELAAEFFVARNPTTKCVERINVFNDWNCRADLIEKFLQAYYDMPKLTLLRVVALCNVATGYPLWALYYNTGRKKTK